MLVLTTAAPFGDDTLEGAFLLGFKWLIVKQT